MYLKVLLLLVPAISKLSTTDILLWISFLFLSGFVIGYAYDDRWGKNFTMKDFFKRRLIRLHPMVIMGAVLGAITFCIQGCVQWDGTHVAISMIMLSLLCTIFFIPAMPGVGYEVRGNGEMFPLNGPCWSLFLSI